jgi:hypothetical protein
MLCPRRWRAIGQLTDASGYRARSLNGWFHTGKSLQMRQIPAQKPDAQKGRKVAGVVPTRQNMSASGDMLGFYRGRHCAQVVGEGNNRQQNEDQHAKSNELYPSSGQWRVCSGLEQTREPYIAQQQGDDSPDDIKEKFHAMM